MRTSDWTITVSARTIRVTISSATVLVCETTAAAALVSVTRADPGDRGIGRSSVVVGGVDGTGHAGLLSVTDKDSVSGAGQFDIWLIC